MTNILWITFTGIFSFLAIHHYLESKKNIPKHTSSGQIASINGVKVGLAEFIDGFNSYIESLNATNKRNNISAAIGYLVAALTSILSLYLS